MVGLCGMLNPAPPLPPCCTGPELAYALVGWDVGTWTDDLYKAEQDASKARREKLASAVKRVRTFSVMGGMGALLLGACKLQCLWSAVALWSGFPLECSAGL